VKRSEMLEYIEFTISDYLGEKIHHPDVLANLLLKEIEELGMLPPNVLDKPTSEKLTKFQEKMFKEDFAEIHCHVWEPEDE